MNPARRPAAGPSPSVLARRWSPFLLAAALGLATLTAVLPSPFSQLPVTRSTDAHGRHRDRRAQPPPMAPLLGAFTLSRADAGEIGQRCRARTAVACPMRPNPAGDEARMPGRPPALICALCLAVLP